MSLSLVNFSHLNPELLLHAFSVLRTLLPISAIFLWIFTLLNIQYGARLVNVLSNIIVNLLCIYSTSNFAQVTHVKTVHFQKL